MQIIFCQGPIELKLLLPVTIYISTVILLSNLNYTKTPMRVLLKNSISYKSRHANALKMLFRGTPKMYARKLGTFFLAHY